MYWLQAPGSALWGRVQVKSERCLLLVAYLASSCATALAELQTGVRAL